MNRTYELPAALLAQSALLIHIAGPAKDGPMFSSIRCSIQGNEFRASATDRFKLATLTAHPFRVSPVGVDSIDGEFEISPSAAKFITTHAKNKLHFVIAVDDEQGSITFTSGNNSLTESHRLDKFPPVENLIETWNTAEAAYQVNLDAKHLADLTKILPKGHFFAISLGSPSNSKPGPVRLDADTPNGKIIALLQPKLVKVD